MTLVERLRKQAVGELCGRSSGLRTLVRYGLGMTGNQDDEQGGCGGARQTAASCAGWMEPLFLRMKAKIEETAKSVCETDVKDAAVAEKVARQIDSAFAAHADAQENGQQFGIGKRLCALLQQAFARTFVFRPVGDCHGEGFGGMKGAILSA